jgi:hypothetical protein
MEPTDRHEPETRPNLHPFSNTPPPASPPQQPPFSLPAETQPRRRPGRPLRLTREVHDAIVSAIESGAYIKIAAQAAGVGQSTLAGWLARGREAAAAVGEHDDDRLYCPSCDLDRTIDVRRVDEANEQEQRRYEQALAEWDSDGANRASAVGAAPRGDEPVQAHAVLDSCPQCRSDEPPATWTLDADEAPYLELLESVTGAQAIAEVAAVSAWRSAWSTDWRAARDYLARTAPERWAGVTRVQMTTEEAERRIDDAVNEALLAVGIDLPGADPFDDALDEGIEVP